jgi:hypothetical protein
MSMVEVAKNEVEEGIVGLIDRLIDDRLIVPANENLGMIDGSEHEEDLEITAEPGPLCFAQWLLTSRSSNSAKSLLQRQDGSTWL